jgi:RNA polymerase sigma factor (sigma-70 family)
LAAVPSIGRATHIERPVARGADAAGDLYERYAGQIFGYCLHQLGSREEAEDAVQTTFMNAFRGLSRGIVPEVESAWLFKIAHNVCLSRRRSSWRRGRVEAPNNFEVLQEIVPGRESGSDELIRLQDVLEEMPENQRRAILLREWQGLTYREISAELGLSQAAVETLIFRARRSLAQGLQQQSESSTWKRRVRTTANAGGALASIKMLVGGAPSSEREPTTSRQPLPSQVPAPTP